MIYKIHTYYDYIFMKMLTIFEYLKNIDSAIASSI